MSQLERIWEEPAEASSSDLVSPLLSFVGKIWFCWFCNKSFADHEKPKRGALTHMEKCPFREGSEKNIQAMEGLERSKVMAESQPMFLYVKEFL